jgi:16S rRNA C1402 (ribose-2'-O) methylase RsmI
MDDELKAMRQENAAMHAETRRHIDIAFESSNRKLELLAEGLALTREELARTTRALGEKIERTAAETQAMIIERLEGSTH